MNKDYSEKILKNKENIRKIMLDIKSKLGFISDEIS